VAEAMGQMVGHGGWVTSLLVMMMILALMLCLMTAMAGSSRTLYQGSRDGWLPRYLSHVNSHGAPTAAMWKIAPAGGFASRSRDAMTWSYVCGVRSGNRAMIATAIEGVSFRLTVLIRP
jgi:amino acid transporter